MDAIIAEYEQEVQQLTGIGVIQGDKGKDKETGLVPSVKTRHEVEPSYSKVKTDKYPSQLVCPIDCVLVSLTLALDPPPLFVRRKPTPEELKQRHREGGGGESVSQVPVLPAIPGAARLAKGVAALAGGRALAEAGKDGDASQQENGPENAWVVGSGAVSGAELNEHRDVFDTSARQMFESALLAELAAAGCIPAHLIAIEEVSGAASLFITSPSLMFR